jgi:hypothetical protein
MRGRTVRVRKAVTVDEATLGMAVFGEAVTHPKVLREVALDALGERIVARGSLSIAQDAIERSRARNASTACGCDTPSQSIRVGRST